MDERATRANIGATLLIMGVVAALAAFAPDPAGAQAVKAPPREPAAPQTRAQDARCEIAFTGAPAFKDRCQHQRDAGGGFTLFPARGDAHMRGFIEVAATPAPGGGVTVRGVNRGGMTGAWGAAAPVAGQPGCWAGKAFRLCATPTGKAEPIGKSRTQDVRLLAFAMNDTATVDFLDAKGRRADVLCHAPQCDAWLMADRLPQGLVNRRARLTIRKTRMELGDGGTYDLDEAVRIDYLN